MKTNKIYSENEMIEAARYGYEYHQTSQFPGMAFDKMAINNFKQLLESNKLGEDLDVEKYHVGDIMTNDLGLDYPQYYVKAEDYYLLKNSKKSFFKKINWFIVAAIAMVLITALTVI